MQPVLVIEIKVPLSSDSFLTQASTLASAGDALGAFMAALPEGATRTERIVKTGRAETKPRQRRAATTMAAE